MDDGENEYKCDEKEASFHTMREIKTDFGECLPELFLRLKETTCEESGFPLLKQIYEIIHHNEMLIYNSRYTQIIGTLTSYLENESISENTSKLIMNIISELIKIEGNNFSIDNDILIPIIFNKIYQNDSQMISAFKLLKEYMTISEDTAKEIFDAMDTGKILEIMIDKVNRIQILLLELFLESPINIEFASLLIADIINIYTINANLKIGELYKAYKVLKLIEILIDKDDFIEKINENESITILFTLVMHGGETKDKKQMLKLWIRIIEYKDQEFCIDKFIETKHFLKDRNLFADTLDFYSQAICFSLFESTIKSLNIIQKYADRFEEYKNESKKSFTNFICSYIIHSNYDEQLQLIEDGILNIILGILYEEQNITCNIAKTINIAIDINKSSVIELMETNNSFETIDFTMDNTDDIELLQLLKDIKNKASND